MVTKRGGPGRNTMLDIILLGLHKAPQKTTCTEECVKCPKELSFLCHVYCSCFMISSQDTIWWTEFALKDHTGYIAGSIPLMSNHRYFFYITTNLHLISSVWYDNQLAETLDAYSITDNVLVFFFVKLVFSSFTNLLQRAGIVLKHHCDFNCL